MAQELWCVRAGQVPYLEARVVQKRLEAARHAGRIPDLLLLLEHPPVYTKGRRSTPEELPMGEDWYRMQGIEVAETDRGGRVTYHGPGQLVGYPIVDLGPYGGDVHAYIRRIERVVIEALAAYGVEAGLIDGLTGVWTPVARGGADPAEPMPTGQRPAPGEARKIGSIGVHVNREITTHGFAVNVNNDLQPFEWIVPCGIEACRMTSLRRELGSAQDLPGFATTVRQRFAETYRRRASDVSPEELSERIAEAEPLGAPPTVAGVAGAGQPAALR